jgi:DNA-binding Xre family transcriptional regulator
MPISFEPMRNYMKEHHISYYYLANEGIELGTLQRIRHDRPITTTTLGKLCRIMHCKPEDLICYQEEEE